MSPQPVAGQCSLISSLNEFPDYSDWLKYPGNPPILFSNAFSSSPSICQCVAFDFQSPAIAFHQCFFLSTDVSAPIRSTLHSLTSDQFPVLGLVLVPDAVVTEAAIYIYIYIYIYIFTYIYMRVQGKAQYHPLNI